MSWFSGQSDCSKLDQLYLKLGDGGLMAVKQRRIGRKHVEGAANVSRGYQMATRVMPVAETSEAWESLAAMHFRCQGRCSGEDPTEE